STGGLPHTLCDASNISRGGTWNRNGVILFGNGILFSVPAEGGEAIPLESPLQGQSSRWPIFLPDGRHFLFTVRSSREGGGIYAGALDSKDRTLLLGDLSSAAYSEAPSGMGYLLFVRGGALMAQPFDAGKLRLSGGAFPVAEQVGHDRMSLGSFSVSENGVLVYDSTHAAEASQWVWFDRAGKRLGTVGEPGIHRKTWLS